MPTFPVTEWHDDSSVFETPEKFGYDVYTYEHDRIVEAKNFEPQKGAMERRRKLENIIRSNKQLTRRVTELLKTRGAGNQMCVSMLIDHSGSMNRRAGVGPEGGRQTGSVVANDSGAVLCAGIAVCLASALEACGAATEVLGFTTREWKGGASRADWLKAGKPQDPGRLNDLLHIIYKRADEHSVDACIGRLDALLSPTLLKENIDGEAIAWARERLLERTEADRLLILMSDGAPVDDSTLHENVENYLHNHLMHVIDDINHRGDISVAGIGIGYDVSRYIAQSVIVGIDDSKFEDQIDKVADVIVGSGALQE